MASTLLTLEAKARVGVGEGGLDEGWAAGEVEEGSVAGWAARAMVGWVWGWAARGGWAGAAAA